MALELKTVDELNHFVKHNKNAVIDFYADWCVPCKALAPQFESLSQSEEMVGKKIAFAKFNIDIDLQHVKEQIGIRGVPTVLIYTDCGAKHVGVQKPTAETIKSRIESLI
jgi:thiol-disulfide isomerase/thioredoxin